MANFWKLRAENFSSPGRSAGLVMRLLRFALKHVWLHPRRLKFAFSSLRLFRDSGLARTIRKSGLAKLFSRRLRVCPGSAGKFCAGKKLHIDGHRRNVAAANNAANEVLLFTGCVGSRIVFARERRDDSSARSQRF